ncbi:MAG: hypothetical protein FJX33_08120 [Alphaproteobacteria bacterium]|nr:hypothetical protein [Alphaproteobacteria bacterium]
MLTILAMIGAVNAGAAIYAWVSMRHNAQSFTEIKANAVAPLIDLKALSDAYPVFEVDASHKIRNGNFTWEEGATNLTDAVKNINRSWSALAQAQLPPSVQEAFAQARERRSAA